MGWGGARTGAGRKPKSAALRALQGSRTRPRHKPPEIKTVTVEVERPADLTEAERAIWDAWAPHAQKEGTLVPATAYKFKLLVQAEVLRAQMRAQIDADGLIAARVNTVMGEDGGGEQTFEAKGHPLIPKLQAQERIVAAGMLAFRLAPNGKPFTVEVAEPEDEFAEFDGLKVVK